MQFIMIQLANWQRATGVHVMMLGREGLGWATLETLVQLDLSSWNAGTQRKFIATGSNNSHFILPQSWTAIEGM